MRVDRREAWLLTLDDRGSNHHPFPHTRLHFRVLDKQWRSS